MANERYVIRTDGTQEFFDDVESISELAQRINTDCLDTVSLRHDRVMLVDDLGQAKNLPINHAATAIYHSVCRPGVEWQIRGDVVIVPDADFMVPA